VKYEYQDLSPAQFEVLVIFANQHLLGISVQGFADGADGGRDAKFVGTAEIHPSKAKPWTGTTIIQAKHTNGYNKHFLETDFFNPSEKEPLSVLGKEVVRIKRLRDEQQLDNYMLFANRRLTGGAESKIRSYISKKTGVPESSIYICGIEQLEIILATFPEIVLKANIDPIDSPLIVSSEQLAVVIQALADNVEALAASVADPPVPRISYAEKNETNDLSPEYARAQRRRYLKETGQIKAFLAAPENDEILRLYESVVEDFELKIISKRKDYQTFDEVLEYLASLLFNRDPILRKDGNRRLTRAILFYMYWICDIGNEEDAQTN
jgi:hypothetical protein